MIPQPAVAVAAPEEAAAAGAAAAEAAPFVPGSAAAATAVVVRQPKYNQIHSVHITLVATGFVSLAQPFGLHDVPLAESGTVPYGVCRYGGGHSSHERRIRVSRRGGLPPLPGSHLAIDSILYLAGGPIYS
eukprot:COSAG02_NODE_397_length_23124_cov_439.255635_14_plen_131_part_00